MKKNIYDSNLFLKLNDTFDVIFLDPPYKDKNLESVLINIYNKKILNKNGIIIIHKHKNEQDILPKKFRIIEEKKYGISKILFLSFLD